MTTIEKTLEKTELTTVKRGADRANYDVGTIHAILDATSLCHVGFNLDGQPIVTPTIHWRDEDYVYWHGSRISRTLLEGEGTNACLTVTHLDGLVLAKSAFHHSANYRSVMVFGKPEIVDDVEQKTQSLIALIDKMMPGRWETLREMSKKEFAATTVLRLPIQEASAKVRTGGPNDLDEDLDFPVWAGVIPMSTTIGEPVAAEHNLPNQQEPANLREYLK